MRQRKKEEKAKGIKGYLLYSPVTQNHFFRVYNKKDPTKFKDYKITAEDIEIKLMSNFNALIELDTGEKILDYTAKVLGN